MIISSENLAGEYVEAFAHESSSAPKHGPSYGYKCFPPGQNRKIEFAHSYATPEEVADFLASNRGWGVRMRNIDGKTGVYSKNIKINGLPL